MPISFEDIQQVARDLHAGEGDASKRSAVSRNFYAALHAAEHWIAHVPGMPSFGGRQGGMHVKVGNQLRGLDPIRSTPDQRQKGIKLAIKLDAMKVRRVIADYKLTDDLRPEEMTAQHVEADDYLRLCRSAP